MIIADCCMGVLFVRMSVTGQHLLIFRITVGDNNLSLIKWHKPRGRPVSCYINLTEKVVTNRYCGNQPCSDLMDATLCSRA